MRPFQLIIIVLLLPKLAFSQIILSNPVEVIKKGKIKKVNIYKTKLNDSINNYKEELRLIFIYDSLGRRISTLDFHHGQLVGTYTYFYEGLNTDCLRSNYVTPEGKMISQDSSTTYNYIDCQSDLYSESKKYKSILNEKGLPSTLVDYSKLNCKNGEKGFECTIEYSNNPENIIRLEYEYY